MGHYQKWVGASGGWQTSRAYDLDDIPEIAGVYLICKVEIAKSQKHQGEEWIVRNPLRIGQSADCHDRLVTGRMGYEMLLAAIMQGATHAFIIPEHSEKRRLEIEADLIQKYAPPFNPRGD